MNRNDILLHRLTNIAQSLLLIVLMAGLMGYLALLLAGPGFALVAMMAVVLLFFLNPSVAPALLLKLYRSRPLARHEAPELFDIMEMLAQRAQLPSVPQLYYVPNQFLNAFAVGHRRSSAVALSDGILRRLNTTELAGVMAHEISHIRNNDVMVMGFADISRRITRALATAGTFLLFLNLPLLIFSDVSVGWVPILALLFAPLVSDLAQLALSRVREFQADLGAAELLGDPRPLMSALQKMERLGMNFIERWVLGGRRREEPSLLRTHPTTGERLQRLQELLDARIYGTSDWSASQRDVPKAWPFVRPHHFPPRWPRDRYLF